MDTVSSSPGRVEHQLACELCGQKLLLQPILRPDARGELKQTFLYRCSHCSILVLHPVPTPAEAAVWIQTHQ